MPSRYDITFTGRVQGVFFRATTEEIARRHAVTGWVRNERDGSVRCLAEGEPDELDRFVASIQRAKQKNIDETRIERTSATGEFDGFRIRY
ncbi:MAG: acylphosphatase [Planctomycetota bacterium]|jgi:acylphosphatase